MDVGLRWSNVNPAPGKFSFGWFDQVMAAAQARQEKPLYVLGMTPGWAATDPHDTTCRFYVAAAAATPGSGPGQSSPPKSLASWDDYVRHVVTRYRGRIESYEIWNEANLHQYWNGTPATLALMSRHAIAIIGSVDPAAIVVSASTIFQDSASVQSWMKTYARSGGYAGTDRVGLHLYPWSSASGPEAMVPLLRTSVAVLAAVGVHQPVWNTEIAFGFIWGTNHYAALSTALQQADIARLSLVALATHVSRSYFYSWAKTNESIALVDPRTRALTPAGRTADLLAVRLIGASLMYCESGDGHQADLAAGEWQCAVDNDLVGSAHEYTLARWATSTSRRVTPGTGAAGLTTMSGAQAALTPSVQVGIGSSLVLITYRTSRTAARLTRLPARAAPPTVSAGTSPGGSVAGTARAIRGFVRSAGSGVGVPGGLVQLWRRPLGSVAAYSYAAATTTYGNGYYGFRVTLSASSAYQVRFGGTRTEAPVTPPTIRYVVAPLVRAASAPYDNANAHRGRVVAAVSPNHRYQTVTLQRWTGRVWSTVVVTRLSGASSVTFSVPQPGHGVFAYRVVKPYADAANTSGVSKTAYLHWH